MLETDAFSFSHRCNVVWAGQVPYEQSWQWQRSLLQQKQRHPTLPDWLILLEHPPIYTLGQGATTDFLKFDPEATGITVHRTERGGEVTYHAPGQLVGYPILNLRLRPYQTDLHWYLRQLEEVIIRAIAPFGLQGERIDGLTGVWVEGYKVAAIGIKVSRWITMHGFALNVCPDLAGFQRIVPCGIEDRPVGCLCQWRPDISMEVMWEAIAHSFGETFGTFLTPVRYTDLVRSTTVLPP